MCGNGSTKSRLRCLTLAGVALAVLAGCRLRVPDAALRDELLTHFHGVAEEVEYDDVNLPQVDTYGTSTLPFSVTGEPPTEADFWNLDLSDAIQIGLANSTVLRDLGGTVLQTPAQVRTILEPSIVESDPRFGVEAALSAFDAQFSSIGNIEKNDRAVNNELLTGGARLFQQDLAQFQTQISKHTATGAEFALRNNTNYDANNASRNLFHSSWQVDYEFEFRQPLGQGRGLQFNRIAGPLATPGSAEGVVIARVNTDISLANFELGLRDLVNNIENAYWELYFAYRDLDVKIHARDRALTTWRSVYRNELAPPGQEAYAREQYYLFEEAVQNALSGRVAPSSANNSGLAVSLQNTAGGVYVAERRLRLLLGLPANDRRLIRPARDPSLAKIVFDWGEVTAEALSRRAELRAQRSRVERRELQLIAARNFMLPRFDIVGQYRYRGFGKHLMGQLYNPTDPFEESFQSAYNNLARGDHQEWQLGFELAFPIGFRQAHAAVRNAQLELARSKGILDEQQRLVIHDLSNVMADVDRAYLVVQLSYDRRRAAGEQLEILEGRRSREPDFDLNQLLDAQRRKVDADSRYFRALAEYAVAIKNVHFAKGTLMEYNNIFLSDGPWPGSYAARDRIRGPLARAGSRQCDQPGPTPAVATEYHVPVESGELEAVPQEMPGQPPPLPDPRLNGGDEGPAGTDVAPPPSGELLPPPTAEARYDEFPAPSIEFGHSEVVADPADEAPLFFSLLTDMKQKVSDATRSARLGGNGRSVRSE